MKGTNGSVKRSGNGKKMKITKDSARYKKDEEGKNKKGKRNEETKENKKMEKRRK
ncbi:hypothetical protein RhiirA5_432595 [Rhizophagus irregularis]|uniref:Uncharacterized protein n=1 Tax=Rhizophagus irregularis TaxID=588596 RepID=A0A2N0NT56_9GLOM|nr:hypothetical protein RhiirA5_432595 [Rhizophagus irregularis]